MGNAWGHATKGGGGINGGGRFAGREKPRIPFQKKTLPPNRKGERGATQEKFSPLKYVLCCRESSFAFGG